jgi:uncharacterized membrane protein YozB (DUF420 family)
LKKFLAHRFYFVMAVLTAAVVVIGFAPNFSPKMLHPAHPAPLSLWVHTGVFSGWVILVLVQTGLIQASQVSLHRTLGMSTAILGVVLPIVGVWVAIDTGHEKVLQGKAAGESFLLVPFSDMFFFAVLFGLGMWWRKRPDLHRRFMLLASVSLTVAAFARFPRSIVPGGHFNIACDLMILLAVGRDLAVDGRVHRVYLIGFPLLILGQATTELVRQSAWWLSVAGSILK